MSEEQKIKNKANAEAMKSLRKDNGATQKEVGELGDLARKTVNESESGKSTMNKKTKRKMLKGNNVTAEEFRERKEKIARERKSTVPKKTHKKVK